MPRGHYDLLGVPASASTEEIKRAFRREIAKYHPDKVHHLGAEFQEIAAVRSAELTLAYKTLVDVEARAEYDAGHAPMAASSSAPASPSAPAPQSPQTSRPPPEAAPGPPPESGQKFSRDRAGVTDLVRKAAVVRFRQAIAAEFGRCDEVSAHGFEIACAPPRGPFWKKSPPRVLVRFVAQVDAGAVAETWAMAARAADAQRELCVFLIGPALAAVAELAGAISERRRSTPGGGKVVLIPLNTRTWLAHIPNDAPPVAKSLVARLKNG